MLCTSLYVFAIEEKDEFRIFQQYKQDYHHTYSFDSPSLNYMNPMSWGIGRHGRGGNFYNRGYMYNPYYYHEYNEINRQSLEQFTKNSPKDTLVDVNTYNIFNRDTESK